jgi:hypothetical protein
MRLVVVRVRHTHTRPARTAPKAVKQTEKISTVQALERLHRGMT